MPAFERISCGIPRLDTALDNIRLGDNVVWQISCLEDFLPVVNPFVAQAIADGRNLIYIRFASHAPLVAPGPGVKIYPIDLSKRFETFTIEVHKIIEKEGIDAFYVFDCLSEIQVAWSTDLMMSNFFRVTCPYLFTLDTVAYFPIIRGKHSFEAIARIRDTTQLFLDIYSDEKLFYLHPLKVWNRYSGTMFLPHLLNTETMEVHPLTDAMTVSRFYALLNASSSFGTELYTDSLHRYFQSLRAKQHLGGLDYADLSYLYDIMMSRDSKIAALLEKYFTVEDLFEVRRRTIGSGLIGGKACGMLIARKIIETDAPEAASFMEPHDSFYIGSDVFYTYIVENGCWDLRIRQRTKKEYLSVSGEFQEKLRKGAFPPDIREQFRHMLDYYGQSPIIVRSSSILEDGFGNAFAGKYESVFCPNQGSLDTRLEEFEQAVRIVYASTMDPSALEYRTLRGLQERDEQMAILVQRVSGSRYHEFYMPSAAGVGYSYCTYKWISDMDSAAGMLRIVGGLGTRAVDRTEGDYPRLISLDKPQALLYPEVEMRHKFSQHKYDLLNLSDNRLTSLPISCVIDKLSPYDKRAVLEHDTASERLFLDRGTRREVFFVSCQGLADNASFVNTMKKVLATIHHAYDYPVDIEYTVNMGSDNTFVFNLLQCRPLQISRDGDPVDIPERPQEQVLFDIQDCSMGSSRDETLKAIVLIDPLGYYECPYIEKPEVAAAIHEINQYFKQKSSGEHEGLLLLVPGRIGTSSPELGVPVSFADISEFTALCEVAYSKAGYCPELSYGSHMFQDLIEADIFYGAIYENNKTRQYQPELLSGEHDIFPEICPQLKKLAAMIHVYEKQEGSYHLYHDATKAHAVCAK